MQEIDKLIDVMKTLRSENGCNWDKKQTHESLTPFVLEEVYEVVDALDKKDFSNLKEELGDLLFQIIFHCHIANESGKFNFADVAENITEKLIRRHPHVFGDKQNLSSDEVVSNWEKLKSKEKEIQQSVIDGVPVSLPALQRAEKIQNKAATVGFDWKDIEGPAAKVREELEELEHARIDHLNGGDKERIEEELGDLLFSIVNLSRFLKINSESAIRKACIKFENRFKIMEKTAIEKIGKLNGMKLEEMDELWEQAKQQEKG